MKKIYLIITCLLGFSTVVNAQANLPDPNFAPPSNSNYYYVNKGQVIDDSGNYHPEIKYYTENTFPEVYLSDDKVSFCVYKAKDTAVAGDVDSAGRIDLQFICDKRKGSQNSASSSVHAPCSKLTAFEPSQDHLNYYLPQCPPGGITNVPGFARVVYEHAFPNIDVHFYSNAFGTKIYFVIKPGGNPSAIDLKFTGQDSLQSLGNILNMYLGPWRLQFPGAIAYQIDANNNTNILNWQPTWFHNGNGEVTIGTGSYNPSEDLVIEVGGPVMNPTGVNTNIVWATFYGSSNKECCSHITTSKDTFLYHVMGQVDGGFPVYHGANQLANAGSLDLYISAFNSKDIRLWGTYFGGADSDFPTAITASYKGDTTIGAIWVAGYTDSKDLPDRTSNIPATWFHQSANAGLTQEPCKDGFLASFNKGTGYIDYRTYFGGAGSIDRINDISVDPQRLKLYICGTTIGETQFASNCSAQSNGSFPLCPGSGSPPSFFQDSKSNPASSEGFIAAFKLNKYKTYAAQLDWSTLFGGNGDEGITSILKTGYPHNDVLYIGGWTKSQNNSGNYPSPISAHNPSLFPLADPGGNAFFQSSIYQSGNPQLFLARFNSSRQLEWCTFFGQTTNYYSSFKDLAINSQDRLYALADVVPSYNAAPFSSAPNNQGKIPVYANFLSFFYNMANGYGYPYMLICEFGTGLELSWSTFLPGNLDLAEQGRWKLANTSALGIDASDRVYVGTAISTSPVTTPVPIQNHPGYYNQSNNASFGLPGFHEFDNYIMSFDHLNSLKWATYYGGAYLNPANNANTNSLDCITDLALSSNKFLFITGETDCPNSPYNLAPPNAYIDQTYNGNMDAFIAKFDITLTNTGIKTIAHQPQSGIKMYPNPAGRQVMLEYVNPNSLNSIVGLTLVDISGKVIRTSKLRARPGDNFYKLDFQDLSPGVYFLTLNNRGKISSVKFVSGNDFCCSFFPFF